MRYYTIKILTDTNGTEVRDLRGFDTLDERLSVITTTYRPTLESASRCIAQLSTVSAACTRATLGARRRFRRKHKDAIVN